MSFTPRAEFVIFIVILGVAFVIIYAYYTWKDDEERQRKLEERLRKLEEASKSSVNGE